MLRKLLALSPLTHFSSSKHCNEKSKNEILKYLFKCVWAGDYFWMCSVMASVTNIKMFLTCLRSPHGLLQVLVFVLA